jgi:hypothetical protein
LRVRILKHSTGIVERVNLGQLLPGLVYDVPISLGTFLITSGAAEEDVTPAVAVAITFDQPQAKPSPSAAKRTSLIWINEHSQDGRFSLKTTDVTDSDGNQITLWELYEGETSRGRFDTRWAAQEHAAYLARLGTQ